MSIDFQERCADHDAVLANEYVAIQVNPSDTPGHIETVLYKNSECPRGCFTSVRIKKMSPSIYGDNWKVIGRDPDFDGRMIPLGPKEISQIKPIETKRREILTQQAVSYFFNLA